MAFYMIHILRLSTILKKEVAEKRAEWEKEVYK